MTVSSSLLSFAVSPEVFLFALFGSACTVSGRLRLVTHVQGACASPLVLGALSVFGAMPIRSSLGAPAPFDAEAGAPSAASHGTNESDCHTASQTMMIEKYNR